jgi:hypothetical protein
MLVLGGDDFDPESAVFTPVENEWKNFWTESVNDVKMRWLAFKNRGRKCAIFL